jgi:hypothetical protein
LECELKRSGKKNELNENNEYRGKGSLIHSTRRHMTNTNKMKEVKHKIVRVGKNFVVVKLLIIIINKS